MTANYFKYVHSFQLVLDFSSRTVSHRLLPGNSLPIMFSHRLDSQPRFIVETRKRQGI